MSLICMNIRLELRSDAMFSSGHSAPGGEDIALRVDQDGMPFLPGATLKGLLRESVRDCLRWTGGDPAALTALFGLEGWQSGDASPDLTAGPGGPPGDPARRLIFGDLRLEDCFQELPLGQGVVPWGEYLAALRGIGYDGYLTIEREVGPDPAADIAMAVNFLKEKLA